MWPVIGYNTFHFFVEDEYDTEASEPNSDFQEYSLTHFVVDRTEGDGFKDGFAHNRLNETQSGNAILAV